MDVCQLSDACFLKCCLGLSKLSFKEQASFNFMATVTICSGLGAQEIKVCHCFHISPSICHKVMGPDAMILVFWMSSFNQLFHPPLPPSSRGSLVPFHFLPLEWYHLPIWGCWYFSLQSWFQLVIHPSWYLTWCDLSFDESQLESRLLKEISATSDMQRIPL